MDCLFCGIVKRNVNANVVYEDTHVLAFDDIKPQAPVHVLIIPKDHIAKAQDIGEAQMGAAVRLLLSVPKIARLKNIDKEGYRVIMNCGKIAGQDVFHLHLHLMGGRPFGWPPG